MYKVYIVDDERRVRNGLIDNTDWEKHKMQIAGSFSNGRLALDAVMQYKPDIIISDIKMPEMDGIELCHSVRKRFSDIEFLFISGHNDVEYMKEAIRSGVVDYIFKPINLLEMSSVLEKLRKRLDSFNEQKIMFENMAQQLEKFKPIIKERFFFNLLEDSTDSQRFKDNCKFLDLTFNERGVYQVAVATIDNIRKVVKNYGEHNFQLLSLGIGELCTKMLEQNCKGIVITKDAGEYVLLFFIQENLCEEETVFFLEDMRIQVTEKFGIGITFGLGKIFCNIEDLSKNYRLAKEAVTQRMSMGGNQIICFDVLEDDYSSLDCSPEFISSLQKAIKAGNHCEAQTIIRDLFLEIHIKGVKATQVRNVSMQIVLVCANMVGNDESSAYIDDFHKIMALDTYDEILQTLLQCTSRLCHSVVERKKMRFHSSVESAKEIIQQEYHTQLTVQKLAKRVFLAPQYLCILFKQETGYTINDYITTVRITMSQKLLKQRNLKLYEVCEMVGYADPSYFTKIFKKETGTTPSEFRESGLTNG